MSDENPHYVGEVSPRRPEAAPRVTGHAICVSIMTKAGNWISPPTTSMKVMRRLIGAPRKSETTISLSVHVETVSHILALSEPGMTVHVTMTADDGVPVTYQADGLLTWWEATGDGYIEARIETDEASVSASCCPHCIHLAAKFGVTP